MRKCTHTGWREPASACRSGITRLTRIARYVALALYMVDPVHGAAEATLVAEYSSGGRRDHECKPRESDRGMRT
jgi:hypothetical protein